MSQNEISASPPESTTNASALPPSAGELEAARLLLARMGIRPEELIDGSLPSAAQGPPSMPVLDVPTFSEYVPLVSAAVTNGTRRVYDSYWKRAVEHWGDRRIDEPKPSEIKAFSEQLRAQRVMRRNGRGGQCQRTGPLPCRRTGVVPAGGQFISLSAVS